jgi:hypothetical protein
MITLAASTLRLLGEIVAVTNTGSFLWRKLSESLTVQNLASDEAPEALLEALAEVLQKDQLTEEDHTLGYVLLVGLLSKSPRLAFDLGNLQGIGRLFWSKAIIDHVGRFQSTTSLRTRQGPFMVEPSILSSSATQILKVRR